jgi:hypothetical protein
VKTDSQSLVEAINRNAYDLSVNDHLFREIEFLIRLNFSSFSINYCPRACNKVVDALSMYLTIPAVWPDENYIISL